MGYTLVLGGARSGKSRYAQHAAEAAAAAAGTKPIAIVTAQIYDDEMAERVAKHREERGDEWATIEAPLDLPQAIENLGEGDVAVIDCITLWLTNVMLAEKNIAQQTRELLVALTNTQAKIWVVSNEVGWGIVPDNALARRFRDEAGRLNQVLAECAAQSVLIVAGMKLDLFRP
ncbi:bifunctional adenosylcobinamide kinase/adenosylcobinamide-phosphate guanylyltransferase [uncultured Brevundimonas sp.]|uniref:bifunctional adenosylcobinamide kinase/adenosylcobinamide-phosphate guanylyltransferase n=1 Tax=uncultured Brevundimonas sp. TaxID=213418 RepID=UPI002620CDA5|nr:bifunctional adenosylcobinamide kinase/adenosylcobinamide-phosphate guanylyltransferase [uncultured Brevundimonas sp.]